MEEIREQMSEIEDPRHQSYVKYPLADILIIIMCAVLSRLDTLGDLEIYAKNRGEFGGKELGIKKVPCKATFGRILSMIDGKQIGEAIIHVPQNRFGTTGEVAAVDGKAICSTAKPGNPHSVLQILSAYVTSSSIILGQESIHEKTNEILLFEDQSNKNEWESCQTVEKNAGRIEKRICRKIKDISWLKEHKWPGLQSIFSVERIVEVRGHCSRETSYYIFSRDACAKQLMELAREHWKIESMHWILDVTFSEDDCRFLSENAHKSMNALRNLLLLSIKSFLLLTTRNSLLKPVCFPLFLTPISSSISSVFYETGLIPLHGNQFCPQRGKVVEWGHEKHKGVLRGSRNDKRI